MGEEGLQCDICINKLMGVYNTRLLAAYMGLDWRARALVLLIKVTEGTPTPSLHHLLIKGLPYPSFGTEPGEKFPFRCMRLRGKGASRRLFAWILHWQFSPPPSRGLSCLWFVLVDQEARVSTNLGVYVFPSVSFGCVCDAMAQGWAKAQNLNNTQMGSLSSYAYAIMAIHHMQRVGVLPNLQDPQLLQGTQLTRTLHSHIPRPFT
jgi:hypothetical protein